MNEKRVKKIRKLVRNMFAAKPEAQATVYIEQEKNRKLSFREDPTTGTKQTMVTPGTRVMSSECERGQYQALKRALA